MEPNTTPTYLDVFLALQRNLVFCGQGRNRLVFSGGGQDDRSLWWYLTFKLVFENVEEEIARFAPPWSRACLRLHNPKRECKISTEAFVMYRQCVVVIENESKILMVGNSEEKRTVEVEA